LKSTTDPTNAERRRFLLQQIRYQYSQLVERLGKTPGSVIQISPVRMAPLQGRFNQLSHEKLYRNGNHGLASLPLNGLSGDQLETLLYTLSQILVL
jgi:hypothetical protein